LLAGPAAGTGLLDLMPAGTTVRSLSHDDQVVDIDVSGEFLGDPPALARHALVHSIASWPDVEEVRISVDGVELDPVPGGRLLFFYDAARDMLVARPTAAVTARDTLAEYLAGPGEARLTGLPADVVVLQFESAPGSGLIKLNFRYTDSLRAMATGDGEGMRRTLEGLIATLTTGTPETNFVYLDFEGHATLGLGQCANLLRTVQPVPEILNDERLLGAS
jgi:spore germination protein GerM